MDRESPIRNPKVRRNEIDAASDAITSCRFSLGYGPGACDRANHLFWTADSVRGAASVPVLDLSTNGAAEPWAQRPEDTGGDGIVAAPQPASRESSRPPRVERTG